LESESITKRINVEQLTSLFPKQLAKYDKDRDLVKEEELAQEKIISNFKTTHSAFVAAKKGDLSSKKRGQVLQGLDKAYFGYREILSNLEGAKKFYKEFLTEVSKFRDEVYAFTYKRRAEAAHHFS
jgi:programmed cell death 6-interacting protein